MTNLIKRVKALRIYAVMRNAPSNLVNLNILTKTDREHNKICKFAR